MKKIFFGLLIVLMIFVPFINVSGMPDPIGNIRLVNNNVVTYQGMPDQQLRIYFDNMDISGLNFQWYVNNTTNTTDGTIINGANKIEYYAPTQEKGTKYYYCIVTKQVNGQAYSKASETIKFVVQDNSSVEPSTPIFVKSFLVTQYSCNINSNILFGFPIEQVGVIGEISYQWYSNSINSYDGANPLSGKNDVSFSPPTNKSGITYYFLNVKNRLNGKEKIANSPILKFEVLGDSSNSPVQPTLFLPYDGIKVYTGDTSAELHANVNHNDSGELKIQWYKNSTNSTSGGIPVNGATSKSFNPDCSQIGTTYYYFVATNYKNNQTSSITSNIMYCIVNPLPDVKAVAPSIRLQPWNYSGFRNLNGYNTGLGIDNSNSPGIITYQWYYNTVPKADNAVKIVGATSLTYKIPTDKSGLMYYFCIATNKTARSSKSIASDIVFCKVIEENTNIAEYGAYTISDEKNNSVSADFIYKNAILDIESLSTDSNAYKEFEKNKDATLSIIQASNIDINVNKRKIPVQGKYLLTLLVNKKYEGQKVFVYHNTGKSIEKYECIVKDSKVTIETTSFSPFAIAANNELKSSDNESKSSMIDSQSAIIDSQSASNESNSSVNDSFNPMNSSSHTNKATDNRTHILPIVIIIIILASAGFISFKLYRKKKTTLE